MYGLIPHSFFLDSISSYLRSASLTKMIHTFRYQQTKQSFEFQRIHVVVFIILIRFEYPRNLKHDSEIPTYITVQFIVQVCWLRAMVLAELQRTTVIRDIPRQKRSNDNDPTTKESAAMRNYAEGLTGPKKDVGG